MNTTVKIEWDYPEEQQWLCPDNIAIALSAYCPNTKFNVTQSPSTEIKGQQDLDRGNIIRLLQYIQENNWHWEEDALLGDIWYQETESGKSEVLNSGMLADKFIEHLNP